MWMWGIVMYNLYICLNVNCQIKQNLLCKEWDLLIRYQNNKLVVLYVYFYPFYHTMVVRSYEWNDVEGWMPLHYLMSTYYHLQKFSLGWSKHIFVTERPFSLLNQALKGGLSCTILNNHCELHMFFYINILVWVTMWAFLQFILSDSLSYLQPRPSSENTWIRETSY